MSLLLFFYLEVFTAKAPRRKLTRIKLVAIQLQSYLCVKNFLICLCDFQKETSNFFGNSLKILCSFFRRCLSRITNASIFCHLHPLPFRPRPAFANSGYSEFFCGAITCFRQRAYQLGFQMHDHARFHFAGVIVFVLKEFFLIQRLVPIACTQEHFRELKSQFADHCSEIISAVTVKDDKLVNLVTVKNVDNIAEHCKLSTGIHIHIQLHIELTGINAKWYGRKHRDLRSFLPCNACRLSRNILCFDDIRSIRHVILGASQAPQGRTKFVVCFFNGFPIVFSEDVWTDHAF